MAATKKAIHPDIPTDRAWQTGRRLYVSCGYKTQLNDGLRKLGAHWDGEVRALWVGSGKREAVVDLVLLAEGRKKQVEEIKKSGRWVNIPYDATGIRARARELRGIWVNDVKQWVMASDESYMEIVGLVEAWNRDRKAECEAQEEAQREAKVAEKQAEKRDAATMAARRRERIIADSGRVSTGLTAELREISTRRMNKATALESARVAGEVIRLGDGRRGLIISSKVWFTNSEYASSTCWHEETHDEAHWDFQYELLIVEPTEEELDAEVAKNAERADAAEIHKLMSDADKLTGSRADDEWTPTPEEETAGVITATTGVAAVIRAGRLILTTDGRVIWQHPGYYDDYIRSEGISTDPDLVERVRRLLAPGDRTRVMPGQMPVYYEVKARFSDD